MKTEQFIKNNIKKLIKRKKESIEKDNLSNALLCDNLIYALNWVLESVKKSKEYCGKEGYL
jgi:hypothetical protein